MKNIVYGQNFRFGFYDIPAAERMSAIKRAGFDAVMFWWGDDFEETDTSRYSLFDLSQKAGLICNTVHFPSTHADYLWYDDERGTSIEEQFYGAVSDCRERQISNIVLHLTRKLITPPPNECGVVRFARMLDFAEKAGVKIAVENTRFLDYFRYLLKRTHSEAFGFCYDAGHNNCYTPNEDPLSEFGNLLCTTHIHDNSGLSDEHHPMGEGNVDFDKVFSHLASLGATELNLESYCNKTSALYGKITMDDYLSQTFAKLKACAEKNGFELG
ncbi:MAG: sugar phosphate isomerase/epimerase [Clostridiales bacterium]|nr:sugar phosphate isomerase/epimerase [Clostridiales bacterium]